LWRRTNFKLTFNNQCTSATDLGYIQSQKLTNGKNIFVEQDTNLLREETLGFFKAPTVKTATGYMPSTKQEWRQ
jgi:hypothetical protein